MHQAEIDLATVQINTADLHAHPRANTVFHTAALTTQLLPHFIKLVVLAAEFGDVHQAFHIQAVKLNKQAKTGDAADRTSIFFAQVLAHVAAFQPSLDVARGLVGTAFVGTAMRPGDLPDFILGTQAHIASRLLRLGRFGRQPRFGRRIDHGFVERIAFVAEQRFDDAVHQQIGVTANRAGEVGVSLVGQTEVPAVDTCVDGLLHRP